MATETVIPSDLTAARDLEEDILGRMRHYAYGAADTFAVKLALEEGLVNAIKHGNGLDPSRTVRIQWDVDSESVQIVISDEGKGFSPESVPDPTADENLERPCGRGLMLIRVYMDDVSHNEQGNEIRMLKKRSPQTETAAS